MGQVVGHLLGTPGPSGFGSKSTAEDVIENVEPHSKTVIITGAFFFCPLHHLTMHYYYYKIFFVVLFFSCKPKLSNVHNTLKFHYELLQHH
jgi:hypothetical protein